MRISFKNQSGFTFIETIIAFSIVGIFLALTWATVQFLLSKSTEQIMRTRAHFLAAEGIEVVKQIRQTAVNRNRRNGFFRSVGNKNGNYVLSKVGDEFFLNTGENEKIEINEEPYGIYCRTVEISGDNNDSKVVLITVRWGDSTDCALGKSEIAYSAYFGNLD